MNNLKLQNKALQTTGPLCKEKGYISFVDLFIKLGYLELQDYEKWRRGQIPYLEKVINLNLKKISYLMKAVKANCEKGNLRASQTVYKSWGKGSKKTLRFSKSGTRNIEELYSTHFLMTKEKKQNPTIETTKQGEKFIDEAKQLAL